MRTVIKLEQDGGNILVKMGDQSGADQYQVFYIENGFQSSEEILHSKHETLAKAMSSVAAMIEGNIKNGFYDD